MLQFITSTTSKVPITEQVAAVLDGGCRWIQLRMKDASDEEVERVVRDIKPMCENVEAFLILNDRVRLAEKLEVSGVHLGQGDMPAAEARAILGAGAVIGVTVNTELDIDRIAHLDIDYVGMGPFRHTTTKKNLAPVLGAEGIARLCTYMRDQHIEIARVAVGGIEADDLKGLSEAGVNGVAVSGAIANAPSIIEATRLFMSLTTPNLI